MSSARTNSNARPEPGPVLAHLLESLLTPETLVLDARLRVLEASPRARQWLRLGPGTDTATSKLPVALRSLARAALKSAAGRAPRRARFTAPAHGGMRLKAVALPVRLGRDGRGVVLLLQPLSDAERMEESLDEIQRLSALGLLLAGLAHELKNALVPVKMMVELAVERRSVPELADDARRELRRITALVDQVLRFSRTGRHVSGPVRVHALLDEALRLVQRRLEERLITLDRRLEAEHDLVEGDAVQLQQAFLNLLLNAIEAMGTNGVLTVATAVVPPPGAGAKRTTPTRARARSPGRLRVSITDTGAGIPPEHLEQIFQPFFTTKPGGTGLGLAIARRIVQQHGGDIRAESKLKKGTTFHVELPLAAVRARPRAAA